LGEKEVGSEYFTKECEVVRMAIYDILKDAVDIAQKVQNMELLKKLFDAQQQALELQRENTELKELINKMNDIKELANFNIR